MRHAIIGICLLGLTGCVTYEDSVRQDIQTAIEDYRLISEDSKAFARVVAGNWLFFAGAVHGSVNIDRLPKDIAEEINALIDLVRSKPVEELDDFELGYILTFGMRVSVPTLRIWLELYAPNVLKLMPDVILTFLGV